MSQKYIFWAFLLNGTEWMASQSIVNWLSTKDNKWLISTVIGYGFLGFLLAKGAEQTNLKTVYTLLTISSILLSFLMT
jgi:hypothetical protein